MSYISDTTLELVRDRDTATLDWLLHETICRAARLTSAEVVAARDVIHTAMVNAGWYYTHDEAGAGGATIWYQRRPGKHTETPPDDDTPASGAGIASGHPHTAPEILAAAAQCISDRAATRDLPAERSMARNVRAFNALTGHTLTERDGWLFMVTLKAARATAGSHNPDDYIDGAAYFALAGESAQTTEGKNP